MVARRISHDNPRKVRETCVTPKNAFLTDLSDLIFRQTPVPTVDGVQTIMKRLVHALLGTLGLRLIRLRNASGSVDSFFFS